MERLFVHHVRECIERRDGTFLITYRDQQRRADATALALERMEPGAGFTVENGNASPTYVSARA